MPRFCSECGAPLPAPPPVTCRACDTSHWLDAKPCAGALVSRAGEAAAGAPRPRALEGSVGRAGRVLRPARASPRGGRARGARGDRPRGRGGRRARDVDRQLCARRAGGRQGHAQHLLPRAGARARPRRAAIPNEVAEIALVRRGRAAARRSPSRVTCRRSCARGARARTGAARPLAVARPACAPPSRPAAGDPSRVASHARACGLG